MNRCVKTGIPTPFVGEITLRLTPNVCAMPRERAFAVALHTLASAIERLAPDYASAWTVTDRENSLTRAFAVIPRPGQRVSVLDTWNLIHLLREQPDVLTVEPAFITRQNNLIEFA